MVIAVLAFLCVQALAYANGANDVSKGVATLIGSRLASYRRGLTWGACWTTVGSLFALLLSAGLVRTFSTGLVSAPVGQPELFALAVAAGAFGWVLSASLTGFPVSTTHSLIGAIVGAALMAEGIGGVRWFLLVTSAAVPLAVSPLVSAGLTYGFHAIAAPPLARASGYCLCAGERPLFQVWLADSVGTMTSPGNVPVVSVNRNSRCHPTAWTERLPLTDAAHWATSAALSFARGLNDAPKIMALGVLAASSAGLHPGWLFASGALMMGLGSFVTGQRVTETLAEKITDIDPLEGLAASAVAFAIVLSASLVALPVSTTHVASGAIIGAGLRAGTRAVEWRPVSKMVAAWLVTLPLSAVLAAMTWWVLTR